jgi:hypothetical protein
LTLALPATTPLNPHSEAELRGVMDRYLLPSCGCNCNPLSNRGLNQALGVCKPLHP